jgi:hypothetical protein
MPKPNESSTAFPRHWRNHAPTAYLRELQRATVTSLLRESLLDCDIVVDDRRRELESAIRERNEVALRLAAAIRDLRDLEDAA